MRPETAYIFAAVDWLARADAIFGFAVTLIGGVGYIIHKIKHMGPPWWGGRKSKEVAQGQPETGRERWLARIDKLIEDIADNFHHFHRHH